MANTTYIATKAEVYRYVEKITEMFDETNTVEFTTLRISAQLNISRNLASQYLNELVKEGTFIKVNSRPVYFFDRMAIEKKYEIRLEQTVYISVQELLSTLKLSTGAKRGFERAIGGHSSLRHSIEKLKAAITYPNNGLPTLLCGVSGTGKSYLVTCAYEYMIDKQLMSADRKLVTFHCEEYRGDSERAGKILFGEKLENGEIKRGCLERANKGFLCLDDAEYLPPDVLEKLCYFMDKALFQRNGSEKWFKADVRLIFTTRKNTEEGISKNLLHRIPIIIQLAPLIERTVAERRKFLITFFKEEIKRTGYDFFVSQKTFDTMLRYRYPGNLTQMRNLVKTTCANAIQSGAESGNQKSIYFYNLPDNIIRTVKIDGSYNELTDSMIDILNYQEENSLNKVLEYYEKFLLEYGKYKNMECGMEAFIEQGKYLADLYYNYLAFEKKYRDIKISAVEQVINQILEEIKDTYHIYLPFNSGSVLSREIYIRDELGERLTNWITENQGEIDEILDFCEQNFSEEFQITEIFSQRVYIELELQLDRMGKLFFLFELKKNNQLIPTGMTKGIIICHGYSTASSIADTVNRIVGTNMYSAFDLPYEISLTDLQEHILNSTKRMAGYSNLVILVDLGSLENVDTFLNQISSINLAIVNNVSTRLALIIATEILRGEKLETMLKEACRECVSNYKMLYNKKKEKAILFVSESGITVAQRFSELFLNSLPKKIDVKFLPYDYTCFVDKEKKSSLQEQYDILLITGTINPKLEEIPYVSMGDIMSFEKIELVHKSLSMYLTDSEKEQFDKNLLKNFSLQNVVSHLTILNPVKVLEMVREALEQLQARLSIQLKAKTIISLYIHISCLLERLIMKQPIETYGNIIAFKRDQTEFINNVNESFRFINEHFGITIPIEEVAYIYDLIVHNED